MSFYPHKVAPTNIGYAVSSSKASSSLHIQNFGSLNIDTASLGLNFVGSTGTPGSNFTRTGTKGPTGDQGDPGFRGDNIYLLSASWSRVTPSICYTIDTIKNYCGSVTTLYYANTQTIPSTTGASTTGIQLFFDSNCITQITTVSSNTWSHFDSGNEITVSAGVLTIGVLENCDFCSSIGQSCSTGPQCCSGICQNGICVNEIEGEGVGGIQYCDEENPCPEGLSCNGGSCTVNVT